jgi:hypothetical protein
MTDQEHNSELMQVVEEYSANEERIAMLECRLRRIGKLFLKHGAHLVEDPVTVDSDALEVFNEFRAGEPCASRTELDRAYEVRRNLGVQLKRNGLKGLTLK